MDSLMHEFPQVCLCRKLAGHKVGLSAAAAAAIRSGKIHDTQATVVCHQLAPFFTHLSNLSCSYKYIYT